LYLRRRNFARSGTVSGRIVRCNARAVLLVFWTEPCRMIPTIVQG
jgi:hypothetical protein